jgi:hypothetical protein
VTEQRLKMLWERFVTAMNSVGLQSKIVVASLGKQRDASKAKTTPTTHEFQPGSNKECNDRGQHWTVNDRYGNSIVTAYQIEIG